MKRISAIGVKEDGKAFRVVNGKLLTEDLNALPKGRYRLTVEKLYKQKSNPQLGYLHAVVYPLVLEHLIAAGFEPEDITDNPNEVLTIYHVDLMCKRIFASKKIVNRDTGEMIEIPGFKRDFTTVQMMTYINSIRQWDAEYLGGYIPEPLEQTVMQYE